MISLLVVSRHIKMLLLTVVTELTKLKAKKKSPKIHLFATTDTRVGNTRDKDSEMAQTAISCITETRKGFNLKASRLKDPIRNLLLGRRE